MGKIAIGDFSKLNYVDGELFLDKKKISKWWGKTYFKVDGGDIHYKTLTIFGRLLHQLGYAKGYHRRTLKDFAETSQRSIPSISKNKAKDVMQKNLNRPNVPVKVGSAFQSELDKAKFINRFLPLHESFNSEQFKEATARRNEIVGKLNQLHAGDDDDKKRRYIGDSMSHTQELKQMGGLMLQKVGNSEDIDNWNLFTEVRGDVPNFESDETMKKVNYELALKDQEELAYYEVKMIANALFLFKVSRTETLMEMSSDELRSHYMDYSASHSQLKAKIHDLSQQIKDDEITDDDLKADVLRIQGKIDDYDRVFRMVHDACDPFLH